MIHPNVSAVPGQRRQRLLHPRTGKNADTCHDFVESEFRRRAADSLHILHHGDGTTVEQEYFDTRAYRALQPGRGHSGLWLPNWLCEVSSDPAERRMLALVLFYFDDKGTRSDAVKRNRLKQHQPPEIVKETHRQQWQRCRTQAFRSLPLPCIQDGVEFCQEFKVRCLDKPLWKIAAAAGLSEKVGRRVLKELVDKEVLRRPGEPGRHGILVYPNGHTLACRFLKYHGVQVDDLPGPSISLVTEWYECAYRQQAMNRDGRTHYVFDAGAYARAGLHRMKGVRTPVALGTWIDDLVYAACDCRPGPAHLMAQLLWWHGVRKSKFTDERLPRAPLLREGRRWVARSVRQWAEDLGYAHSSVHEWLTWLVETKKFFAHRNWTWRNWNSSPKGIDHYSPEPDAIYEAVKAARPQAKELRLARFKRFKDARPRPPQKAVTVSDTGVTVSDTKGALPVSDTTY